MYEVKNDLNFDQLYKATENDEGLVILGAGGDMNEWVDGVSKMLVEEGIVPEDSKLWKSIYHMTTTGGRNDLVMVMSENAHFEIGKLAMWRLRFGECSWLSDWKVNYQKHYKSNLPELSFDNEDEGDDA